jgi:Nucleotidyl transferase AbiEii toxin, Type IV TA system
MMSYATPDAFKVALEQRLRNRAPSTFVRERQLFIYSRFLARVSTVMGDDVTLKGGLALELRLAKARSTKDIDLGLHGTPPNGGLILERLQAAARLDLEDFLTFEVAPDLEHPTIENDGMRYDGFRFRGSCKLAGREYGSRFFGIDVSLGDPLHRGADELVTHEWLDFVGIPATKVRAYRVETHIAEKLHAYTMPRARPNSRLKDLPDLALLGTTDRVLERTSLRASIHGTFRIRGTHEPPAFVPDPPQKWEQQYPRLARENDLPWKTIEELLVRIRDFLNPVLTSTDVGQRWNRESWSWG